MRTAAVLLLALAAISCAQDKKPEDKSPHATAEKKRLESVTWDLKSHKLVWVIQKGTDKNGEFVANSADRYEISPDDAVMAFAEERRGFTKEEAASLHKLLDTLSLYCAESVVWWDQGEGTPVDGSRPPRKVKPEGKGQRVEEKREPLPRDRGLLIARFPR